MELILPPADLYLDGLCVLVGFPLAGSQVHLQVPGFRCGPAVIPGMNKISTCIIGLLISTIKNGNLSPAGGFTPAFSR